MADDFLKTSEILNLFDENKQIRKDAPDEVKYVSYLTELYTAGRLLNEITEYVHRHPRLIDIKITDITDICAKSADNSVTAIKELIEKISDEAEEVKEILEELKEENDNRENTRETN